MTNILFVYHNELEESFIPASLAVLGGVARDSGAETKLFDTSFWRDINSDLIENDRQARERTGEYKKVEGYNPERELVDIKEKFYATVEEYHPDLIAATSTSYEFNSLIDSIYPTKKKFNMPVIVGGIHATIYPDKAIQKQGVDMICLGEGEKSLSELIIRMEQGEDYTDISNLWIKTPKGKIIKNKLRPKISMDDIPEPNWDMFDPRHRIRPFEGELKSYGYFEISRGCPHKCSYCANEATVKTYAESGIYSKMFRFHSPEEIVRRMEKYKEKYEFNHIQFVDENLTVMPIKNFEKLAELYKKNVDVGFFTMGRAETIANNPRKAELLAEMNCRMFALGLESGNVPLRESILNRHIKNETLEEAARILKENGILVSLFNIIGFPTETKEMIFDTIRLNRKIQPDRYSVRFLNPYPGTAIRDYCIKNGYIEEDYEEKRKNVSCVLEPVLNLPSPPHPTKQELFEIKQNWGRYIQMSDKEFERVERTL